jgi:hypothetical protein
MQPRTKASDLFRLNIKKSAIAKHYTFSIIESATNPRIDLLSLWLFPIVE